MQSEQLKTLDSSSAAQIENIFKKIGIIFKLSDSEAIHYNTHKGSIALIMDILGSKLLTESLMLSDVAAKLDLSAVEREGLSTFVTELLDSRYGIGVGTHFINSLLTAIQTNELVDDFMRNQFDINEEGTYLLISLLFLSSDTSFKTLSGLDQTELRSYAGGINTNHSPGRSTGAIQNKIKLAREIVELGRSSDSIGSNAITYPKEKPLANSHLYQHDETKQGDSNVIKSNEPGLSKFQGGLPGNADVQIDTLPRQRSSGDPLGDQLSLQKGVQWVHQARQQFQNRTLRTFERQQILLQAFLAA